MPEEKINRRPKAVVALGVLLAGLPLKFPGDNNTYRYQDGMVGVEGVTYKASSPDTKIPILIQTDLSLEEFISLAEKLSEDKLFIRGCEKVLIDWNSRKSR